MDQLEQKRQDLLRFFDAAGRTLELAASHERLARESINELNAAIKKLAQTTVTTSNKIDEHAAAMNDRVASAVQAAMNEAVARSADILTERFQRANHYADEVAERYRSSAEAFDARTRWDDAVHVLAVFGLISMLYVLVWFVRSVFGA